jgi:ABC-2 type transport system permease protein
MTMSAWRQEWLRLRRTPRGGAVVAVYLTFGLLGPVMAKYAQDIIDRFGGGSVTVIVAPPTPRDGVANFISQVSQTGLLALVVVAAGAFAFDARRGIATFLRTRARTMWDVLAPRLAMNAALAVVAYSVGTAAAWYETALLIGPLSATDVLAGVLCGSAYLLFAVALTAAAASIARTVLGTVGLALGVLLVLPILGIIGPVHDWLPSSLVTAPVSLVDGARLSTYLPALASSAAGVVALTAFAAHRLGRREV